MSNILLIRHGESESNAGLPTTCPERVELTEQGIEQAEYIAEYLKSQVPPDLIVTSSYERTKQTAAPTMSRFPFVPKDQWLVHEFTYLASSLLLVESSTVIDRRPLVEGYWETCDPSYADGPKAESFRQFIWRVRGVIKRLKESSHETIAIFSHEQFICAVRWLSERNPVMLDEETMRDFRDILKSGTLPNGAILRMQFDDTEESPQWQLITSHLDKRTPIGASIHV